MTLSRIGYCCVIALVGFATLPPRAVSRCNDRRKRTPEELAATVRGSVANFGTWPVDEAAKTLTYQVCGSSGRNRRAPAAAPD